MKRLTLFLFIIILGINCRTKGPADIVASDSTQVDSSWYGVEFYSCDGNLGTPDEVWTHGDYYPYDTVQTIKGDSLIISFDFIANCCLTFSGRATVKQDTLVLKYGLDKYYTESCGCSCEYTLRYRLNKTDKVWSNFKIIHQEYIFKPSKDE